MDGTLTSQVPRIDKYQKQLLFLWQPLSGTQSAGTVNIKKFVLRTAFPVRSIQYDVRICHLKYTKHNQNVTILFKLLRGSPIRRSIRLSAFSKSSVISFEQISTLLPLPIRYHYSNGLICMTDRFS